MIEYPFLKKILVFVISLFLRILHISIYFFFIELQISRFFVRIENNNESNQNLRIFCPFLHTCTH